MSRTRPPRLTERVERATKAQPEPVAQPEATPDLSMNSHLKRIIVADDDPSFAQAIRLMLESSNYEVVGVVGDGQQAIESCRANQPDLAILDIQMPGLCGLEAALEIAKDPGTPTLILTAHANDTYVESAATAKVQSFLIKPVDAPSLCAAVRMALARSEELQAVKEDLRRLTQDLKDRKLIEQAKGLLMEVGGLTENEAYTILRKKSQDARVPIVDLAKIIIENDGWFH